ncbi:putative LPS assembly protein LptD [Halomarinibacterium sedimenti]|uniref:putative LPS assembly protein LptD n=1 Tax=Halomarinibacterium sedimenti TaxID=2857106 RepID=UPI002105C1E5|nr:putative LPS assembly protein LptD [Halomarinibacterium sedimenti]
MYSQDPVDKGSVVIPAKEDTLSVTPKDTLTINPITYNEVVVDTVKVDSIAPKDEILKDIVDYYGEDYVYMDKKSSKVYMYNKAFITYQTYRIDAGLIILDYNKNEVTAKGIDSAGVYSQKPIFVEGSNKVEPDSIRFNFTTKKAIVYNSRTFQNEMNVLSEITKKENDSVYFLRNVKFTTAEDIENPEYYFYTRKAKFVPQKKVVTGLTNMYIADVPTPIGLPFAFFPLSETRTSGFLLPNIGENNNRGFFLQNGGYYFAINDYIDLTVLGDYYTNGSYGFRLDSDYALRYKFRGNVSFRYENLINSERGFPDFTQSSLYNIRWSHNQDQKVNPSSRFSASVNLGSSRYLQQSINQTNNASQLVNTLSSSVSYSKSFETEPQIQFTIAGTHSQNTQTEAINMSLPNFNGSVSRIFPFAPKNGVKKGAFQNINMQYNVVAENRISTTDSLFFKKEMFEGAQIGARHTIPISTNFKVLKYLSFSLSTNYQETWVGKTISRNYDETANDGDGAVVQDTISGFDSYRTYGFSTGVGTTIYGTFNFGKDKKIQAIRHVMRPSIGYSISPGFQQYYDEYTIVSADPEINDQVVEYSRFENTLYGAPGKLYSSSMSLALSNTLEAKIRDKDTTAVEPKKLIILNNLNFSTGYNFSADSLKWSNVQVTGSIPIVKKLDFNFNGSLDPYALDNDNNRINTFNIENGGSLFRLVNGNISFNYSFSSKDFEKAEKEDEDFDSDTFRNGGRPDDLFGDPTEFNDLSPVPVDKKNKDKTTEKAWYQYDIPWDLRLAYTLTYSNSQRQNEISSQSLMMSSSVTLSPKWSVRVSSGYDFKNKGVTLTQLGFVRDLDSWTMRFNWTPIGARNTSWNFFIGIKGSILKDIKYDKRREADRNL